MLIAEIPPDGVTLAYVLKARPVFDMLTHAAAQLAAFCILATTGSDAACLLCAHQRSGSSGHG